MKNFKEKKNKNIFEGKGKRLKWINKIRIGKRKKIGKIIVFYKDFSKELLNIYVILSNLRNIYCLFHFY